jgi:hypothetical protein
MLNEIILPGNLGADPEVSYSLEGHPVASFNPAFRVSKNKTRWIKRLFRRKVSLLGMLGGNGFPLLPNHEVISLIIWRTGRLNCCEKVHSFLGWCLGDVTIYFVL